MTKYGSPKVILKGVFADVQLKIPATTTYKEGTVLGRDAQGALIAYKSADCEEALYILAQTVTNAAAEETVALVKVLDGGSVNKDLLVFADETDAAKTAVLDNLKRNGFHLENVQELTEDTCLKD